MKWVSELRLEKLAGLLVLFACAASADAQLSPPTVTGTEVGELTTEIPKRASFVVHGTMPIARQPYSRTACPLVVVDPDGRPLETQWELVAVLKRKVVVELSAFAHNPGHWTGRQTFRVMEGTTPFHFGGYSRQVVDRLSAPGAIRLWLKKQNGVVHRLGITTRPTRAARHRFGPNVVTIERDYETPFGGVQTWLTFERGARQVELIVNWHNGLLPARPDFYFEALGLEVPDGMRWTPLLPDPAMQYPLLVKSGKHVLPQRWERPFRVVIHPANEEPDLSRRGWAVGDWSNGGYMAQSLELPDLSHLRIDLTSKKDDDFDRLANLKETLPGSTPVNALYPAQGVYYGGMTGGAEIHQFPEIQLAWSGQPDGLLSTYVEQLRYAARQMGCIYQPNGLPIDQDRYLNPDGSQPFDLFNNEFIGNPTPRDAPFGFSKTGPGHGSANYDPNEFLPIDYQHYVRRTKANKALIWLDNDPLAARYLLMDAELGRMCFYEGPGGRLQVAGVPGLGTDMGRGHAWVADAMAHAYAIARPGWRRARFAWFASFKLALETAQMPNRLFSALNQGKTATSPPYGDGHDAFFWVHRTNEQIFLMHALRAFKETVGLDTSLSIRTCGRAIWDFAWKVGTNGPLEAYPAGPIGGPRYTTRAEIPAGLTDTVGKDNWHVANALAFAELEGAAMVPALLAMTEETTLAGAKARFLRYQRENLENRAAALSLLQKLVP